MALINNNGIPSTPPPAPITRQSPIRPFTSSYMPTTMLPGFYVNSDADISARDVPADGSVSFFPCKDLTHIVAKRWDGNTLESAVYVLQQPQQSTQQPSQPLPPPPPPVHQSESQSQPSDQAMETMLQGFNRMNEGIANAFGQFGNILSAMQQNLEKLNSRFDSDSDSDGGMG